MTTTKRLPTLGLAKPHFYKRNDCWHFVFGYNHIVLTQPNASPAELVRRARENGIDLGPRQPGPSTWRTEK